MSYRVNVPEFVIHRIKGLPSACEDIALIIVNNVRSNGNQDVVEYLKNHNPHTWTLIAIKELGSRTLFERIVIGIEKLVGQSIAHYCKEPISHLANDLSNADDTEASEDSEEEFEAGVQDTAKEVREWIEEDIEVEGLTEKQKDFLTQIVSYVYSERPIRNNYNPMFHPFDNWIYTDIVENTSEGFKEGFNKIIKSFLPDWTPENSDRYMDVLLAKVGEENAVTENEKVEDFEDSGDESVSLDNEVKEAMQHLSEVFQLYGLKLKSIKIKDDFTYTIRTKGKSND